MRVGLLGLVAVVASCSSSSQNQNPCLILCNKANDCRSALGEAALDCPGMCFYGGNLAPGLAPSPSCPDLAGQQTCIEAAVQQSCSNYLTAAGACPLCAVLDGSACASDADCQKYRPDYRCDLSRPGGYCTRSCGSADDCSAVGPELCNAARAPSFVAPGTQMWCMLGCQSDTDCRVNEGYICTAAGCDTP